MKNQHSSLMRQDETSLLTSNKILELSLLRTTPYLERNGSDSRNTWIGYVQFTRNSSKICHFENYALQTVFVARKNIRNLTSNISAELKKKSTNFLINIKLQTARIKSSLRDAVSRCIVFGAFFISLVLHFL